MRSTIEHRTLKLWIALAAVLLLPRLALATDPIVAASGALEAVGPEGEPLAGCPLEHTSVRSEIAGFVARVTVTQQFRNPYSHPIEAIYTFPLSESGAVDSMSIRSGDREIRGEIRRREEAQRIYAEARAAGKLAAVLDQERPNIFTQSIANLMPGARVEIEIQYVETLDYRDGAFEFSFPMVVGPRFIPGRPGVATRVPDASRISPPVAPEGTRSGHDISLEVEIDAGVEILSVDSRLHDVDVERSKPTRAKVRLRSAAEIPNRDFVLRYAVAGDALKSGFLVHRTPGKDGYVTFILLPPDRVDPALIAPRELIFVIDRSGSQSGLPLLKAKETMLWMLDRMNPQDSFQIVSFSRTTEMLFDQPRPVSAETKRLARAYIAGLEANGGTLMAEAIERVTALPAAENRLRIVTFMTDGYVGNDFEVIDLVKRLRGTSRWFPFGTGNSVNRFLLERMAYEGGGEVEYVLLNDPGDRVARKFHERISAPVLTDVSLEFHGLDVFDVIPRHGSDVWAQRPLVVHARYRGSGRGSVTLRGFRAGQPYAQRLDVELPGRAENNGALASIWARRRVQELMSRDLQGLQRGDFSEPLREAVVALALEHRIMTQFTSFVAVEDRVLNSGEVVQTVTVPVELPQGVQREGVFGAGRSRALSQANFPITAVAPGHLMERKAVASSAEIELRVDEPAPEEQLHKLAPALLDLFEGRPSPAEALVASDGRLRVRVTLARLDPAISQALQDVGLHVELSVEAGEAPFVVGTIRPDALDRLAALKAVAQVDLP